MRRIAIIIAVVLILIIGGGLTAQLLTSGNNFLPTLEQVADPEASALAVEPWEAQQFVLLVGFILFNLVGMGVTIALIFWLVSRQIAIVRAQPTNPTTNAPAVRAAESRTPAAVNEAE